jgi:glutamine amidotransferase
VLSFDSGNGLPVPHVGWNNIKIIQKKPLFERIENGTHLFFDHSFYFQCSDNIVSASCEYGTEFVASIHQDNIFATQFHPEKSQRNGLKILRNFMNYVNHSL